MEGRQSSDLPQQQSSEFDKLFLEAFKEQIKTAAAPAAPAETQAQGNAPAPSAQNNVITLSGDSLERLKSQIMEVQNQALAEKFKKIIEDAQNRK